MPRTSLSQYMVSRGFIALSFCILLSAFAFYILVSDLKLPIYSFVIIHSWKVMWVEKKGVYQF